MNSEWQMVNDEWRLATCNKRSGSNLQLAISEAAANYLLPLLLLIYVTLGVIYSLATPVLEASDEFKHYPYVQYVQTQHDLPVLDPERCRESPDECPWLQDGGQPPAYYILMAAATSWIDTSDLYELRRMNWHAFIGNPSQICNKNLIIHRPEQERFPWQGAVLAIHICRFLTLLFGTGTVALTYFLARELFPKRPALALGVTALTALTPMFIFVNASVNNDSMAAFMGNLTILILVHMIKEARETQQREQQNGIGLTRTRSPQRGFRKGRVLLLGVVLGVGLLTKLSLLGLAPWALIIVAFSAWHRRPYVSLSERLKSVILDLSLVILIALAISGWWFLRNWRLYGDPTGLDAFIAIQGVRTQPPTIQDWLDEFVTFRWTYWGLFGAVNVMAPLWVYRFFDALTLIGLGGYLAWSVRYVKAHISEAKLRIYDLEVEIFLPLLWFATLFVSVLRWTWIFYSFQGRLLFPDISGISLLLMLGLHQWMPQRYRPALSASLALILLVIAAMLPFTSIIPAYAQPEPLTLADVPAEARLEESLAVGETTRIVGWHIEPQTVQPDDSSGAVEATVYWEAVAPDGEDYVSFARLLGRDHELVGQVNRRPACGMVPTDLWETGQVWRDPYRVPVAEDARAPSRLRLEVGLYDPEAEKTLGAVQVSEAKLAPPPKPTSTPPHALAVDLADGVSLAGYDLSTHTPNIAAAGDVITLTLYWEAREAPTADYQVFVHILGDQPEPVAQADGPPLLGDYPTSMWAAGERIADPHTLTLPPNLPEGEYRLLVGMYDLETLARLPRLDGAGDAVQICELRITNDDDF